MEHQSDWPGWPGAVFSLPSTSFSSCHFVESPLSPSLLNLQAFCAGQAGLCVCVVFTCVGMYMFIQVYMYVRDALSLCSQRILCVSRYVHMFVEVRGLDLVDSARLVGQ